MTTPHLSTRSLARASLVVSAVALAVALLRVWSAPHTSLPTALAASPKTELRRTFQAHDPAAARAYYLAKKSEDLTTYTHPTYGFSFPYCKDFTVDDLQEDRGELVLVSNPAVGMGFQIFITSDDESGALTATRIQHDLPDLAMGEVVEFTLPDNTPAVRFVSHDSLLGDVGETWFRKDAISSNSLSPLQTANSRMPGSATSLPTSPSQMMVRMARSHSRNPQFGT